MPAPNPVSLPPHMRGDLRTFPTLSDAEIAAERDYWAALNAAGRAPVTDSYRQICDAELARRRAMRAD